MDALWTHTQVPSLHARWDLRFTSIAQLPRNNDADPQRFRYITRVFPGFVIAGYGETIAERTLPDGSRTSSLRFSSDNPFSLIRQGTGYWKYEPTGHGIRFFTWYDYTTRWGWAGTLIDRLIFRPLMGWATAWSFDRLRFWLENDCAPEVTARRARAHVMTLGLRHHSTEIPHASRCLRAAPSNTASYSSA